MGLAIPDGARVLVVGSGAREHAIAWALAKSPRRPRLYAAPGNPGMAAWCEMVNLRVDDVSGIAQFAARERIDLVVVGPELPLALGLADACAAAGVRVFGPSRAAARLESSKAFAKAVMAKAGVPTAAYATFTDPAAAKAYIRQQGAPIVVKADGLAAGKGVVVAETIAAAEAAIDALMVGGKFGAAGATVVIEQFLRGREASLMFFVDGETVRPLLPARDYKRVGDGDTGPNTGGMGAFAPVPEVTADVVADVERRIVRPTLAELRARGIVYRGVLYAGLMLTEDGPYVVEFNARFGDPETEVVLPLLASDLLAILWATAEGRLADVEVAWRDEAAVCVVLAAPGYPERPQTGAAITLPDGLPETVFHAGTAQRGDGQLVTAGGRVLTVTGTGPDLTAARAAAYRAAEAITFPGKHMRKDIALVVH
ncbi:phosphoribosylamine--glycine ligase [Alicyclobacillus cellulosilyticus]|uniref:Phosphoribosylamine--glycine ligase n=1 Tax=Alicyclobacillus cellulosilyticus TaxID=1003997 RepID=A0A917KD72_9BACL|nr:phosphoribosylamine--glycine ligase [Alicyclobacillus cellulosilyticus]GGJ09861.1 phosphoribosylamine--glycine ligase [Alicyclobacillus cellulosilyticus]